MKRQLDALESRAIASELREFGAWSEEELLDRAANERRLVWIAASCLADSQGG